MDIEPKTKFEKRSTESAILDLDYKIQRGFAVDDEDRRFTLEFMVHVHERLLFLENLVIQQEKKIGELKLR